MNDCIQLNLDGIDVLRACVGFCAHLLNYALFEYRVSFRMVVKMATIITIIHTAQNLQLRIIRSTMLNRNLRENMFTCW